MGWYGHPDGTTEKVAFPNSLWQNIVPKNLKDCPKCGAKQSEKRVAYAYFGFRTDEDG